MQQRFVIMSEVMWCIIKWLAPVPIPASIAVQDEAQPAQPAEDVLDSQEEQAHQAMEKLAIYGPWRAVPIYLGESDGNLLGGGVGDATAAVDSPTSADPYLTLQDQDWLWENMEPITCW